MTELYTIPGCPHCDAAREDLEWRGVEFVEYNVAADAAARARMLEVTGGARTVPPGSWQPLQPYWRKRALPSSAIDGDALPLASQRSNAAGASTTTRPIIRA